MKNLFSFSDKMIAKLIALLCVVGLAASAAVEIVEASTNIEDRGPVGFGTVHDYIVHEAEETSDEYALIPHATSTLGEIINAVAGYKVAALSLAVKAIGWIVKNVAFLVIGALGAFGFCKITGKCSFDYDKFEEYAEFRSLLTPDRVSSAKKFLAKAIEKYSMETKKGKALKKAHSS